MHPQPNTDRHMPEIWGDVFVERPGLGRETPLLLHRLLQSSIHEALVDRLGVEEANALFLKAGRKAGAEFFRRHLRADVSFPEFAVQLQRLWTDLGMGVIRFLEADDLELRFRIAVSNSIGSVERPLEIVGACPYERGFIAGLLEAYTERKFRIRDVGLEDEATYVVLAEAAEDRVA